MATFTLYAHLHDTCNDLHYAGTTLEAIREMHQQEPSCTEMYSEPVLKLTYDLSEPEACTLLVAGIREYDGSNLEYVSGLTVEHIDRNQVIQ